MISVPRRACFTTDSNSVSDVKRSASRAFMISPPAAKAKMWTPAHAIPFILFLSIMLTD
jgi:hypothetical protein